jgi:predicted nucleotidyltransferase
MEQKDYKAEIVLELLKAENHVRGIAKALNTNHMNISRKIKELYKENIVDYREEGKNKKYFLKKTSEAKIYVSIAENYKLLRVLEKYPSLRTIIEKIQNNNKVKMAILFGSYAKGLAKQDSDIDIYIDTEDKKLKHELEPIDSKLSIKIGRFDKDNLLIKEIIKNHVVLKGVEEYYGEVKFFS